MFSSCIAFEQLDYIIFFFSVQSFGEAVQFRDIFGPGCPWSLSRQFLLLDDPLSSNLCLSARILSLSAEKLIIMSSLFSPIENFKELHNAY